MPRGILTPADTDVKAEISATTQTPPAVQPAPSDFDKDALAGALPAWDLCPTSPFVRRLK